MDSRALVKKVINFEDAPRIGFNLPSPWPCDVVHAGLGTAPDFDEGRRTEGDIEYWLDEWGCTWRRLGGISKGEVFQGALADWDSLEDYVSPDYDLDSRYDEARRIFGHAEDLYRVGMLPGCAFNVSRKIRRLDNFLADCLLQPGMVTRLNDIVMEQIENAVRKFASIGADAVMITEDWGTQQSLLMAPETFRALFLPAFQRLCGVAAECGVDVWMHSCGNIWEIIDDLIGAGIKVLQFDQPSLYGIDRLAHAFGGRVTFECPVDIQRTLQSRDPDMIRDEARRLIDVLGARGGGFVATRYSDEPAIGLEPKWQDIACNAFVEFGSHKKASA
jgi:uroporphyrinogen decarboxylase